MTSGSAVYEVRNDGSKGSDYIIRECNVYAKVALSGEPTEFFTEYTPLDKHFLVSVVSPRKHIFATVTADITKLRRAETEHKIYDTEIMYKTTQAVHPKFSRFSTLTID